MSNTIHIPSLSERKKTPIIIAMITIVLSILLCSMFINSNTPKVSNFAVVNLESNKQYDGKLPFSQSLLNGDNYISFEAYYTKFSSKIIKLSVKECVGSLSIMEQPIDLSTVITTAKTPVLGYCNLEKGISIDLSQYAQPEQPIPILISSYSLNGNISVSMVGSDKDWSFTLLMLLLNIVIIVSLFYIL